MEQSKKLEMRDTTTAQVEVRTDQEGNAVLGQRLNMELSDLGGGIGSEGSPPVLVMNLFYFHSQIPTMF